MKKFHGKKATKSPSSSSKKPSRVGAAHARSRAEGKPEGRREGRSEGFSARRAEQGGGKFSRGGGGRGRADDKPAPKKITAPIPEVLWAEVGHVGRFAEIRIFHKEFAQLYVNLEKFPADLERGELVTVRLRGRGAQGAKAELVQRHGKEVAGLASLIAVTNAGLSLEFPHKVLKEAETYPAFEWRKDERRVDWRELPFVTIDGVDARDFDDAVHAEAPDSKGYTLVRVAIADVAHYVRPGTALDNEARERGNSTYFPDRVIPMLPERLSNDLCSLRPKEDRPVLGVEMVINAKGVLIKHHFVRAVIHSAARLTYDGVQEVLDGNEPKHPQKAQIEALYNAFKVLLTQRAERGALDLDVGESKILLDKKGEVASVIQRPRRDAERLIEELMICANVAAAEALSTKGGGLYRVHAEPTKEKLETLKTSLSPLGFTVPPANAGPKAWAKLVAQVHTHPAAQQLLRAILQSQQQAKYTPENIGHYGLALPLYSHFTSPIRRYADLILHRALIAALKLPGEGGQLEPEKVRSKVSDGINVTERISQQAEWEAKDRLIAQYFGKLTDQTWEGIVVGVQKFGVFVAVNGIAEGLLPGHALHEAGYSHVVSLTLWRLNKGKDQLRLGSKVTVELAAADRVTARLTWRFAREKK